MLNQTKFNNYNIPSFFHEHHQNRIKRKIKYGMYGKKQKKRNQNFFSFTHIGTLLKIEDEVE
jgi:hypothetical protein